MFQLFFSMYVCFSICLTQLNVWKMNGTLTLPWICKTLITYDIPIFLDTIIPYLIKVFNHTTIYLFFTSQPCPF